MRRPWPILLRICVSVVVVLLLFLPVANFKWSAFLVQPYNAATGANPIYVLGPVSDITMGIADYTWWVMLALPEALFGALAGIGVFVLLSRFSERYRPSETRCRRCRQLLRGLDEPKCPACDEPL